MDFLQAARRIGLDLLNEAQELGDGSLTWGRGAGRNRAPVLDSGPYEGRCGEALLFAALCVATGEELFEEASLRALQGLRQGLPEEGYRFDLADKLPYGLVGIGGILYVLVQTGRLLGSPELLDCAELLASVFTRERTSEDSKLDIIWGTAGAMLGLLALADTGSDEALRRAEQCAAHLLAHRTAASESGPRAWSTLRPLPSSGFAHGASGIAHALLMLFRRTGSSEYYHAAIEAFSFERSLYREQLSNWADSAAEPVDAPLMWSWCHGAPGIGLSRLTALDCLHHLDEAQVALDLRHALAGTLASKFPEVDTACCGHFGRIDFLLEAGLRLGNASLGHQARRIAQERLQRAASFGFDLTSQAHTERHLGPGFWQGLGGTAYTLLRLIEPERYPCVLAMA